MSGLKIVSKKYLGKKQTYNFEMQSDFHNYIINGVVSKNSHAVAYSYITYQTAYLKSNYPVQFMCSLLNCNSDDIDKLNMYIGECFRLGVKILPPHVNESNEIFAINEKDEIRFGLGAIKGLGKSAVTDIMRGRKNGAYKSVTDFIERTSKVDKSSIQALLRVGAFNGLEKHPKKWDKMVDYLQEGKNSKYYQETLDLERAIYTTVGTKQAKKSDKYLELVELKRNLRSSKYDLLKKEEYTNQQNELIDVYIEHVNKYFLQFTGYKPSEKISNEQELLGFNISTNPYKRWNDLKKFFTPNKDSAIPYVEMNELIENNVEYKDIQKLHTVGLLSDIKELKTKKGDRMAKLTLEYNGVKTCITIFPDQWQGNLEFKIQKGNMLSVVGKLIETNKKFTDEDYEIRAYTIRQLNVLVSENNKYIINIDDKDKAQVDSIVKRVADQERKDMLPIEKIVLYKKGEKYLILSGLTWVNNPDKVQEYLSQ